MSAPSVLSLVRKYAVSKLSNGLFITFDQSFIEPRKSALVILPAEPLAFTRISSTLPKVETGRFIVETLFNYITFFILLMRFRLYQSVPSYDRQADTAYDHPHQILGADTD